MSRTFAKCLRTLRECPLGREELVCGGSESILMRTELSEMRVLEHYVEEGRARNGESRSHYFLCCMASTSATIFKSVVHQAKARQSSNEARDCLVNMQLGIPF